MLLMRPAAVKGGLESLIPPEGPEEKNAPQYRCPRCDSMNTKFCYFNNYSRSQPRHFCRACRRYWTEGGTLRSVPVGGNHKNKRRKVTSATDSPIAIAAASPASTTSSATLAEHQAAIIPDSIGNALHPPPELLKSPVLYTIDSSLPYTSLAFMEEFSGAGLGFVWSGERSGSTAAASSCFSSHYSCSGQDVVGSCDEDLLGMMNTSTASKPVEETAFPASYWEFWQYASDLTDAGGRQTAVPQ